MPGHGPAPKDPKKRARRNSDPTVVRILPRAVVAHRADLLALGALPRALLDEGAERRRARAETGHDDGLLVARG